VAGRGTFFLQPALRLHAVEPRLAAIERTPNRW
jgi:hypothetical protein